MRWCIPCLFASLLALAALVAFVSLKAAIDGASCPPQTKEQAEQELNRMKSLLERQAAQ